MHKLKISQFRKDCLKSTILGLDRMCLDILLQIFGPRPLNPALPKSIFHNKPLPEVCVTPQQVPT